MNTEKSELTAKALVIAMNEYERLTTTSDTVGALRTACKCSSPAHTMLSMYIDGALDQMRSMIFAMSGFDYDLLEDMEEEVGRVIPDFKRVVDKWMSSGSGDGE